MIRYQGYMLEPISCVVTHEALGQYECEIVLPLDHKAAAVVEGDLLPLLVPEKESPAIELYRAGSSEGSAVEIWRTTVDQHLLLRPKVGSPSLRRLPAGTEYERLRTYNATWHEAALSDGTVGALMTANTAFVRTGGSIQQPQVSREQMFRVYAKEADTAIKTVTLRGRHISYDASGVMLDTQAIMEKPVPSISQVIQRLMDSAIGAHDIRIHTERTNRFKVDYRLKNLLQAIMEPDEGIAWRHKPRLVRDNLDFYILWNYTSQGHGVLIEHGKNLLGVKYIVDQSAAITRLVPVGQDKDGKEVLRPAKYVDSPRINDYPVPRAQRLDVPEARMEEGLTLSQVYVKLLEAAQAEFAAGVDLPDIHMEVDMLALGDTEEYKQYRLLERLYMWDFVTVRDLTHGFTAKAQVKGFVWDVLRQRYQSITLGNVHRIQAAGVASYELPSLPGAKIAAGTVPGSSLQDGSVASPQLAPEAVQPDHLSPHAVEVISQSATGQQVMVRLSHGGILDAENTSTTASLHVHQQGVDITDTIPDAAVRWERVSDDAAADATWNADPARQGVKSLEITGADVDFRCVLRCLVDEAVLYAVPDYVDGELLLSGPDAANFSLSDGQLVYSGEIDYTLRDGELSASATVGGFALEVQLSNLLTEQASQTRYGYEVYAGGNVKISAGGDLLLEAGSEMNAEADLVRFTTDSFNVNNKDDRELLRLEEDELAVGADVISAERYVGPIVGIHYGSDVPWQGSIQASIDNLPKYLNQDTTLTVPAGSYYEDVVITGFVGSLLRVSLSANVTIYGSVDINNCANFELIGAADKTSVIVSRNTSYAITAKAVGRFYANRLRVSGKYRASGVTGTTHAMLLDGVQGAVTNCVMEKVSYCLTAGYGSSIYAANNTGGISGGTSPTSTANLVASYRATVAGIIFLAGTAPDAPSLTSVAGGQINGASTPTTETSTIPNTPDPTVTKYNAGVTAGARVIDGTYVPTNTTTYGSSSFSTGVNPSQGTIIIGGNISFATKRYFGLWMLPTITNKANATKVTLTVRRSATGGTISAVPFRLMYTTSDWASISGVSMAASTMRGLFTDTGLQANLARGQSVTWNITGSLLTAFKNGTIKGFGMRDAIGSNLRYMPMNTNITIEVTTP